VTWVDSRHGFFASDDYIVRVIGWPAKAGVWFLFHPGYAIFTDGNFSLPFSQTVSLPLPLCSQDHGVNQLDNGFPILRAQLLQFPESLQKPFNRK